MTDGCREIRRALGEAPCFFFNFFHGAHREFTARFIGLVRVSRGSRLALKAPEVRFVVIGFSHTADT